MEARSPSLSDEDYIQTLILGFINIKAPDSLSNEQRDFVFVTGLYNPDFTAARHWELLMVMNYCYGLVVDQPEPDDVDRCEGLLQKLGDYDVWYLLEQTGTVSELAQNYAYAASYYICKGSLENIN